MNSHGATAVMQSAAARSFFASFFKLSVRSCPAFARSHSTSTPTPTLNIPTPSRFTIKRQYKPKPAYTTAYPSTESTTTSTPPSEPPLSSNLRSLMRSMPHSVVVGTSTIPPTSSSSSPQYAGITLSSFTSLTLTPTPIVTFNIRRPSSFLDAITASGRFNIHVLAASGAGAALANTFSKPLNTVTDQSGAKVDVWKENGDLFVMVDDGFSRTLDGSSASSGSDPPLLAGHSIEHVLCCEVLSSPSSSIHSTTEPESGSEPAPELELEPEPKEAATPQSGLIQIGDHTLVLGAVTEILTPRRRKHHDSRPGSSREMLRYSNGVYRNGGKRIFLKGEEVGLEGALGERARKLEAYWKGRKEGRWEEWRAARMAKWAGRGEGVGVGVGEESVGDGEEIAERGGDVDEGVGTKI